MLGSRAVAQPTFDFDGIPNDIGAFIKTAFTLENTGVHAYLGQAGNIKTPAILEAAATIVTVEARHAAASRPVGRASRSSPPRATTPRPRPAETPTTFVLATIAVPIVIVGLMPRRHHVRAKVRARTRSR